MNKRERTRREHIERMMSRKEIILKLKQLESREMNEEEKFYYEFMKKNLDSVK
jgi:hypothetical protein